MFSTFYFPRCYTLGGPLSGGGLFFVRQLGGFFGGDAVARDAGSQHFHIQGGTDLGADDGARIGTQK